MGRRTKWQVGRRTTGGGGGGGGGNGLQPADEDRGHGLLADYGDGLLISSSQNQQTHQAGNILGTVETCLFPRYTRYRGVCEVITG